MRPTKRKHANKSRGAAKFRHHTRMTKAPNMAMAPMRGGWRL